MSWPPSDRDATGRSLGQEELELLAQVIDSGRLFAPHGHHVKDLEVAFGDWLGVGDAIACSSGTAAIHAALAALELDPGDEVITTPITDMGALAPVLYQGLVPVFADVDGDTGNVTPSTIRQRVTERTRAVIVTHLFGNPADTEGVASQVDVPIIEDCAQAFGATVGGELVGTRGDLATFSLQQGKHITTGEGGIVATSDPNLAREVKLFVNKAWDYDNPSDHDKLGLNYRMSELQGAVAVAQLAKLDPGVGSRIEMANRLADKIEGLPGISVTPHIAGARHSYWRFCLLVDRTILKAGPDDLAAKLKDLDIPSAPRYIKKPAFQTGLFANKRTFGSSSWPFDLATPDALDYSPDRFPGTFSFLGRVLVFPWNERLSVSDVDRIAEGIQAGVMQLQEEAA
ncbi:MAG: DegT/DnrJ/EryC1/StrS family aminotransferase [Acidimicrobiia bacterium]